MLRFDPEKPLISNKPTPKVVNARLAKRDRHQLATIPETVPQLDSSCMSSKELHSSLKSEKSNTRRVHTVETFPEESGERRSQWELLMRKFSEDCKVRKKCRLSPLDYACRTRDEQRFLTGSSYIGTWNILGMNGYGTYTFPNGVVYEGEFCDSCFHGEGVLKYPSGIKLSGQWENGVMKTKTLVFGDDVEYKEDDWKYCRMPDRRFMIERDSELRAGTDSFMTADRHTRPVPPGYYDTGEGFYHPQSKAVCKYDVITDEIRYVGCPKEQAWIQKNCRTYPDKSVGPKCELYESWADHTQPDEDTDGLSNSTREPSLVNIDIPFK